MSSVTSLLVYVLSECVVKRLLLLRSMFKLVPLFFEALRKPCVARTGVVNTKPLWDEGCTKKGPTGLKALKLSHAAWHAN